MKRVPPPLVLATRTTGAVRAVGAVLALAALGGCGELDRARTAVPSPTPYVWKLPASLPPPIVPEGNPMTVEKVTLGRYLFYDKRLSANQSYACGSCHFQRLAFTDGRKTPVGSTGVELPRNAPSLVNVGYYSVYTWSNPLLTSLEQQIFVPMFSDAPPELNMADHLDEILARLAADPENQWLFRAAYPDDPNPFTLKNTMFAITSFLRSIVSADSAYDRYQAGDRSAMSDSAVRGMQDFFSDKFSCYHCHQSPTFSDSFASINTPAEPVEMHDTGLYNFTGKGPFPPGSLGLYEFTRNPKDIGKFKAPSLRNVELTGPYFHDGSAATLEEVIDLYARGGRVVAEGPLAGDGRDSPNRDPMVHGIDMTAQDKADLIAFLKSLTDHSLINNPSFGNPYCADDLPQRCDGAPASFTQALAPIITATCSHCHGPGGIAANRPLVDYQSVAVLKEAMFNQLSNCSMPPADASPPLGEADRAALINWLLCGAPQN